MKPNRLLLTAPLLPALLFCACKKSSTDPDATPAGGEARPASTGAGSAADAVELKVRWQPGRRYVQRMELAQTSETRIPNVSKSIKQDTTMAQDYAVTVLAESANGGRELELEFQDTELTVTTGGREVMSLDTKGESLNNARDPMTKLFRELVGTKLRFTLDARNEVQKVEGVKEFMARLAPSGGGPGQAMLTNMFHPEYFKQMVAVGDGLPDKPVKPGDSWPHKRDIAMGPLGSVNVNSTHTFKQWEQRGGRRCARLEFAGTLSSKGTPSAGAFSGANMTINNGVSTGTVWFDPADGMVVESEISQKMSLQMTMNIPSPGAAGAGGAGSPQTITVDMTQKINFKIGSEG
jgi:hypothetical protein